jgi:hypothetical protein
VTDAGLAHLKDCKGLMRLWLSGTGITDAGLAQLKVLTGLETLFLNGTQVTARGVADFQAAVSRCKVTTGGSVIEGKR